MGTNDLVLTPAASVALAILVGFAITITPDAAALAQMGNRDTSIFTEGKSVVTTANDQLILWARALGVGAMIVCGIIWTVTGRANWRWLAGALGGLFIAGVAGKIVDFIAPS